MRTVSAAGSLEPFERDLPSRRSVRPVRAVPGAVPPAEDGYAVGQVLAWLAKERRELPEQVAYTDQIPALIELLLASPA